MLGRENESDSIDKNKRTTWQESTIEKFVEDIQKLAWASTPEIKRKTIGNNYSKEIKDLIREKHRWRKKWHQTRNSQDKTKLNNLTKQLTREINKIKNESINGYLRNLTNDKCTDYSLWKVTKRLKKPIMHQHWPPMFDSKKWNEKHFDGETSHRSKIMTGSYPRKTTAELKMNRYYIMNG